MMRHEAAGVGMTVVSPQLITTRAPGASLHQALTTTDRYTITGRLRAQEKWIGLIVGVLTATGTAGMVIGGEKVGGRRVRPVNFGVTLDGALAVVIERNGSPCMMIYVQRRDMGHQRIELGSQHLLGNQHPAMTTRISGILVAKNQHNRNPSETTKSNGENGAQTMVI